MLPYRILIYTGDKKDIPQKISVRRDLFNNKHVPFDAEIDVITQGHEGTIIYEYVMFTKVYGEQYKLYGATNTTITETIRICKDRNILKEFLAKHEKEVVDVMMLLFDDEFTQRAALKEQFREGKAEGMAEGEAKGKKEGVISSLKNLMNNLKLPFEQAAAALGIPQSEQAKYAEMLK